MHEIAAERALPGGQLVVIAATHRRPNAAEYLWQRRNIGKHFGWFSLLTY